MQTLKVYNSETIFKKRGKPPVVRISYGRIIFSVEAVNLLGLKSGDKLSFATNLKDKEIIYFKKDEKGIPLLVDFEGLGGIRLRICCRPLAKELLSFFLYNKAKTFSVNDEMADVYGEKMWFILKSNVHKPINWKK
jgi:hypothetical protein